jgi:hypothetical protein
MSPTRCEVLYGCLYSSNIPMHAYMATQLLSFHHGDQVVFDVVRAHEVVLLV